jgi:hypothetical protein
MKSKENEQKEENTHKEAGRMKLLLKTRREW